LKGQTFVAKTFNCLATKSILKMIASDVYCAANDLISTYKFDLCSEFETPEDYANDVTQDVLSYTFCSKEELLGINLIPRAFPFLSLGRREKALAPGGPLCILIGQ
jgi:hypothetical protein